MLNTGNVQRRQAVAHAQEEVLRLVRLVAGDQQRLVQRCTNCF